MGLCWVRGSWGPWLSSHGMQVSHWGQGGQQCSGELEGRRAEVGQPGARWLGLRTQGPWGTEGPFGAAWSPENGVSREAQALRQVPETGSFKGGGGKGGTLAELGRGTKGL